MQQEKEEEDDFSFSLTSYSCVPLVRPSHAAQPDEKSRMQAVSACGDLISDPEPLAAAAVVAAAELFACLHPKSRFLTSGIQRRGRPA